MRPSVLKCCFYKVGRIKEGNCSGDKMLFCIFYHSQAALVSCRRMWWLKNACRRIKVKQYDGEFGILLENCVVYVFMILVNDLFVCDYFLLVDLIRAARWL